MKNKSIKPILFTLLSTTLLSSCGLKFNLSELSNEPKEAEADPKYLVSKDFFDENMKERGLFMNYSFTAVSDNLDKNNEFIARISFEVDHNKFHYSYNMNDEFEYDYDFDSYYINKSENVYDYYFINASTSTVELNREIDYILSLDELGLYYPKSFDEFSFDKKINAYTLASYSRTFEAAGVGTIKLEVTNIAIYFENNVLKRMTSTIKRFVNNEEQETYKVDFSFTKWGETSVSAPEIE